MMKIVKYSLTAFLILLLQNASAQVSQDSIFTSIQNIDDSVKIVKLKEACWNNRSKNPLLAIKYADSAISVMKKISDYKHFSETNNYLGVIFGNLGLLDSAYYFYKIAINHARESDDSIQIAYSLNNIGDYYYKNALFSTALENIFNAYKIFERLGDESGMAYTLNDIGEIYLVQMDYQKALENFLKSGEIRYRLNDYRGYAKSLLNQAATYEKQNLDEVALNTYEIAKEYCIKSNYVKGQSWVLSGISDIYFKQMRLDKALEMRNEALKIDKEIGNKYGEIINYNQMGAIYLRKGDYKSAEKYLNLALREGEYTGHLDQMLISYDHLKEIAMRSNNYLEAYTYLENYSDIRENIFSRESSNKIADLQMAFITERKDRENEILKKNIEIEQNLNRYLITATFLILGIVLLYISKFRAERKSNKELNEVNKQLNELNAQKDKLFSIIGHDLKNSAGVVQNYLELLLDDYSTLKEEEKKTFIDTAFKSSKMLTRLLIELLEWGRISRDLVEVKIEEVNLREIINRVSELYQSQANEKSIKINVNLNNIMIHTDKNMLNTVMRNIVSNAVKFTNQNGVVDINYNSDENYHYISTKDNGTGIQGNRIDDLFRIDKVTTSLGTSNEKGTGLGLPISNEFLKKCNGELIVKSVPAEGSEFIVKLPKS